VEPAKAKPPNASGMIYQMVSSQKWGALKNLLANHHLQKEFSV
jgi:hypothetical protein